ncbi:hypothetical protein D3C79_766320 [compost metagenome]
MFQQYADIAVHDMLGTDGKEGDQQCGQHRLLPQWGEPLLQRVLTRCGNGAQRQRKSQQRNGAQQGNQQENLPPTNQPGQEGAKRNAKGNGQRHAAVNDGDSQPTALFRHQPDRSGGGLRRVGRGPQRRQHATGSDLQKAVGKCAGQITDDKQYQGDL